MTTSRFAFRLSTAIVNFILTTASILVGGSVPAAATFGSAASVTYGYDTAISLYDGAAHSVQAPTGEPAPVALLVAPEGVQGTVATVAGPLSALVLKSVAADTADSLLPGLPETAPKPLGLGSTGRVTPANLTEQLAMEEVRSNPAGVQLRNITMSNSRWPAADGWAKMQQIVNGVNIHYVENTVTGAVDDFKFVGGAG